MKSGFIKNNVFRSLIFSYLIISLILMILNYSFTSVLVKKLIRQHSDTYKYSLSDISDRLEQTAQGLELTSTLLFSESKSFVNDELLKNNTGAATALNSVKTIYSNNPKVIDNLGIYFPDYDLVLSMRGIQPSNTYFITYFDTDPSVYASWIDSIKAPGTYFLQSNRGVSADNRLFYHHTAEINGINTVFFSSASLNDFYKSIHKMKISSDANIVIYNKYSNVVICPEEFRSEFARFLNGEKIRNLYLSETVPLSWECFLFYDNAFFSRPVFQLRIMLIFMILLSVIFIGFSSVYFSKVHYKPIKKLVGLFGDTQAHTDEFGFLQTNINEIINNNRLYLTKTKRHDDLEKLQNLVRNINFDENISVLRSDTPDYAVLSYVIAVVKLSQKNADKLYEAGYTIDNIDTIFTNIIEEIAGRHYKCRVFPINGAYCVILGTKNFDRDIIKNIFEESMRYIENYYNVTFMVSISDCRDGCRSIPALYKQACETMPLIESIGSKNIRFYTDVKSKVMSTDFNMNIKNKLVNYIMIGNVDSAAELMCGVIDEAISSVSTTDMLDQIFFKTLTLLSYTLNTLMSDEGVALLDKYNPSEYIFPCSNINELKTNIYKYFTVLCSYFTLKDNSTAALEEKLCQYIKDNYRNPNLSAVLICDVFQIHNTYLSRIFSEKIHMGMHDYITNLRIEKSKELLLDTNKRIEEIALEVGYTNVRSFSRAFKRTEGISPSEYRSNDAKRTDEA